MEVVIVVCNCGANCLLGGLPGSLDIFFQPPIVRGSCPWQLLGIKDIFEKLPRLDYQNVMIGWESGIILVENIPGKVFKKFFEIFVELSDIAGNYKHMQNDMPLQ